ncbi:chorismate mutase [Oceanimonas baumannii]|uniref:Chorismate mutase n=1 Tax=Oceanimonas baumannii TaxID=129578 RepID=A0A235CNL3_9GAMM|nr:chorismate mutase [Oceanimonas baumannii]TDW62191.1 chorismate mutase [Oceanimonas baumannii]
MNLDDIRNNITRLDQELLSLLAQRKTLSLDVARSKLENPRPIRDQEREQALLVDLVSQGRQLGLDAHFVTRIFHTIIEDSVLSQQALLQDLLNPRDSVPAISVAFLGLKGSYSNMAARKYLSRFQAPLIEHNCESFQQIFETVESGQAQYGILPIENTSSGAINDVFDLMQHTRLSIVGELTQPIEHCLLVATDTRVEQIKTLYTHSQPYQQCSQYLSRLADLDVKFCAASSNAMEQVARLSRPDVAALGSADGGALHGLVPLVEGLANQKQNMTRFIVVARKPIEVAEQIPAKTSFIMSTGQQSGALVEALLVLRNHGITMTRLESRPIIGNPWEEMFYVDVAANANSGDMQSAMKELGNITRFIKVMGCYPSAEVSPTRIPARLLNKTQTPKQNEPVRYSRHYKADNTRVQVGPFTLGGDEPLLIAELESWPGSQLDELARSIKEQGGQVLALDCFTDVGTELGLDRLQQLHATAERFDLAAMTRVTNAEQVHKAAEQVDWLLLDAKASSNDELLSAAGRCTRPLLLELAEEPEHSLKVAQHILQQGNQQLALLDSQALPLSSLLELSSRTHLPLVSRLSGDATTLPRLGDALHAAGVSGFSIAVTDSNRTLEQLAQSLYR